MKSVQRIFATIKALIALLNKLLPLVGDIMECIKMVDTLVDTFNTQRENGKLKDVGFVEYFTAIVRLVSDLAPLGYTFVETIEKIFEYASKFEEFQAQQNIVGN